MLAVDTNVIVRYLTRDHPAQASKARELVAKEDIFIATTVLLETEWVLRSIYGFAPVDVVRSLRAFAGLPNVTVQDGPVAARALDLAETGLDFADALHMASAHQCTAFVSFDRDLVRQSGKHAGLKVRSL